jgi:hypothetical protein
MSERCPRCDALVARLCCEYCAASVVRADERERIARRITELADGSAAGGASTAIVGAYDRCAAAVRSMEDS